tara:strand:+ start:4187 stop:5413 length:1227 start_codon:yes stop_codon:yes gene_type:complete
MSIFMVLRVALKALARNKMRTSLTMLGMIIGVAAVITMVALGRGAQSEIEAQVQSAGTNMITVRAGNYRSRGVSMGMGQSPNLNSRDVDAIRERVPDALYLAAGVRTRDQIIAANQNWNTTIQGTDIEYPQIRSWATELGTFFTTTQVQSAAKVAVLGSVVRDNLYGEGIDPVGARIRIRNQSFQIIGVMSSKGAGQFGEDQDDVVFIPYSTVNKKLRGRDGTNISQIDISAASADSIEVVADQIADTLREEHALGPGEDNDFMVRTQEDLTRIRSQTTQTMTGLLASIAGVSLIVGGIGIMNIMLVSVTERTREIGLRMAVGAKSQDVLLQFLVEAVVLSLVGGLVGVGLGFGLSETLTRFLSWPTSIPADAIVVAVGFAAATGIFFGFYPARKASRLDPIDALRFE